MDELERDCETCLNYDGLEGECKLKLADQFEVRSCDTSECEKYEKDPFYEALEEEE